MQSWSWLFNNKNEQTTPKILYIFGKSRLLLLQWFNLTGSDRIVDCGIVVALVVLPSIYSAPRKETDLLCHIAISGNIDVIKV